MVKGRPYVSPHGPPLTPLVYSGADLKTNHSLQFIQSSNINLGFKISHGRLLLLLLRLSLNISIIGNAVNIIMIIILILRLLLLLNLVVIRHWHLGTKLLKQIVWIVVHLLLLLLLWVIARILIHVLAKFVFANHLLLFHLLDLFLQGLLHF